MLGTNDSRQGVPVATFIANITQMVAILEAQHIVVLLSTIPPNEDPTTDAVALSYCQALANFANSHGLPLIDFRSEILARQPGSAWIGTLINSGDVHPTAANGSYTSASDPYMDGGDPSTHTTGASAANVGYLLRSWLTVQKLKQVKAGVVDHTLGGTTTSSTTTTTTTTGNSSATGSTTTGASSSASGATGTGTGTVQPTSSSSGSSCGLGGGGAALLLGSALAIALRRRGELHR
jgi:hypothetical protein